MIGYEETVEPAVQHAILAGHDMIFLGEDPVAESAARVAARWSELPEVQMLASFVRGPAKRPLCVPRQE